MNRHNKNGYQTQQRNQGSGGVFLPLAIGAVVGGVAYKLWDSFFKAEEPPKPKSKPEKMFRAVEWRDMGPEEELFVYENLDQEFKCNLSLEVMNDPVILECGHNFDRQILIEVLKKDNSCPLCRKNLTRGNMITNFALKNVIQKEVVRLREQFKKSKTNNNNLNL